VENVVFSFTEIKHFAEASFADVLKWLMSSYYSSMIILTSIAFAIFP